MKKFDVKCLWKARSVPGFGEFLGNLGKVESLSSEGVEDAKILHQEGQGEVCLR